MLVSPTNSQILSFSAFYRSYDITDEMPLNAQEVANPPESNWMETHWQRIEKIQTAGDQIFKHFTGISVEKT